MEEDKTLSETAAKAQVEKWLETQAALHEPDQIAGGNPEKILGLGNARINSSIGSQWKSRADDMEKQIRRYIEANKLTDDELDNIYLNIEIKYVYKN